MKKVNPVLEMHRSIPFHKIPATLALVMVEWPIQVDTCDWTFIYPWCTELCMQLLCKACLGGGGVAVDNSIGGGKEVVELLYVQHGYHGYTYSGRSVS